MAQRGEDVLDVLGIFRIDEIAQRQQHVLEVRHEQVPQISCQSACIHHSAFPITTDQPLLNKDAVRTRARQSKGEGSQPGGTPVRLSRAFNEGVLGTVMCRRSASMICTQGRCERQAMHASMDLERAQPPAMGGRANLLFVEDDQREALRERPHLGGKVGEVRGTVEVDPLLELLAKEGAGLLLRRQLERADPPEHVHIQLLQTLAETDELEESCVTHQRHDGFESEGLRKKKQIKS